MKSGYGSNEGFEAKKTLCIDITVTLKPPPPRFWASGYRTLELADLVHPPPLGSWVFRRWAQGGVMDDGSVSFGRTPPYISLLRQITLS